MWARFKSPAPHSRLNCRSSWRPATTLIGEEFFAASAYLRASRSTGQSQGAGRRQADRGRRHHRRCCRRDAGHGDRIGRHQDVRRFSDQPGAHLTSPDNEAHSSVAHYGGCGVYAHRRVSCAVREPGARRSQSGSTCSRPLRYILGGGNLLRSHLKKISDRQAGWAYSIIVLVSFLGTLFVGLAKIGVEPSPQFPDYSWSGAYRQTGSAFWYSYQYGFQPLTSTIFALLAFYIASAAFRAFRAKLRGESAAGHRFHRAARPHVCRCGADQLD